MPSSTAASNTAPSSTQKRVSLGDLDPAIALGPLDGRYRASVAALSDHLSEAALNRNRILVEIEWFIYLAENQVLLGAPKLSEEQKSKLRSIATDFSAEHIAELAEIERQTVHDVKAVEYFITRRLDALGLGDYAAMVHFAATSEDINNLAYALGVRDAVVLVWNPAAQELVAEISALANANAGRAMLSHTHGQPATPTTLGKELQVSAHRLGRQLKRIANQEYLGKINGATGTYSAHTAAVPGANWPHISREFVESLGLSWNPLTTQIESHDWQSELYADIARFNSILHNFCTDIWSYISIGYFRQIPVAGATGSSTMPHKINPIRFENAEANLELSNAILGSLAQTLVTSRWQRDLTDSTSQRNIGVGLGHSLLAIRNVLAGLTKLDVAPTALEADLDANWEVLGEAIQTVMRAEAVAGVEGMDEPYERLKELTRGHRVDAARMREFVLELNLSSDAEARLLALTPATYTGLAEELTHTYPGDV